MCIIIAKNENIKLPSIDTLEQCEARNGDGIGFALKKAGKEFISIKKGFKTLEAFLPELKKIDVKDSAIIHFRFCTSGTVSAENCHPFPITPDKNKVKLTETICRNAVAHNGTLNKYNNHKKLTDSQKFTVSLLSKLKNSLHHKAVQALIEDHIGFSKLAILNSHGLQLIGKFIKNKGLYYSNDGFEKPKYSGYYYGFEENCEGCRSKAKTKLVKINREDWYLCRKCRKANEKGTLKLEDLNDFGICEYCENWVDSNTTKDQFGLTICENCQTLNAGSGYIT